ncbi:MAG: 4Fe-4S dicluster domain-containing protein [Chloroflexota bacterium]
MTKGKQQNKPKKTSGHAWVLARRITQYLFLGSFLLLFIMSRRDGGWPGEWVNIPMRLDPLIGLAQLMASRTFLAGSALALITVLLTLVFGRALCGWICPLGTTLDFFPFHRIRAKKPAPPESWRGLKYLLLVATLTAALLGNLSLLSLDPLTIFFRTLTTAIWPALDRGVIFVERALFSIPFLSDQVASFDAFIRPAVLPVSPATFQHALLFGAIFLGIVALNAVAERFWCRYLCPLGGLLGLVSKIALFKRKVGQDCPGCPVCSSDCPTGTIDPEKGYASDPGECTMCLDCLESCPRGRIAFVPGQPGILWNDYDPGRRETLLTIAATSTAAMLVASGMLARREPSHLIRPPGAREANPDVLGLTKCIRCSECMRACPTNAIQPGVFEAGVQGFGAPLVIPRLGYCDFSCNACGQVCPSQAIPALSLEEKQLQVIGRAYIDENRCIAWSDHVDCIVCEEMCPLPEKAIQLEEQEVWGRDNSHIVVKLPHVLRETCIGCGICEYKCPVNGESAIRVYVPETGVPF